MNVDALIGVLSYKDLQVRKEAVWALGELADKKAIYPLNKILIDKQEDKHIQLEATIALGKIRKNLQSNTGLTGCNEISPSPDEGKTYDTATTEKPTGKGRYCPFCFKSITKIAKICPHCGKTLVFPPHDPAG